MLAATDSAGDWEIIDRYRNLLGSNETIAEHGEPLALTLIVRAKLRGGRAVVLDTPDGDTTN